MVLAAWLAPSAARAQSRLDVSIGAATGDLDVERRSAAIDRVRTELSMCDPAGAADLRVGIDAEGAMTLRFARRARSAESRAWLACASRHLPALSGTGTGTLTLIVAPVAPIALDALPADRHLTSVSVRTLSGLVSPADVRAAVAAHLSELDAAVARCALLPGTASYGISLDGARHTASLITFEGRGGEVSAECLIPTIEGWSMPTAEGTANVLVALEVAGPRAAVSAPPPTGPVAQPASISIRVASGPLAATAVESVLARQQGQLDRAIARCDAAGDPVEDGTLTVSVSAEGRVTGVDAMGAAALCLSPHVRRWVFPASAGPSEIHLRVDR